MYPTFNHKTGQEESAGMVHNAWNLPPNGVPSTPNMCCSQSWSIDDSLVGLSGSCLLHPATRLGLHLRGKS